MSAAACLHVAFCLTDLAFRADCSTDDYFDCEINGPKNQAPLIEPLLRQYDVDLFLAGHLHNFERTFPVFGGVPTATNYSQADATVYVQLLSPLPACSSTASQKLVQARGDRDGR